MTARSRSSGPEIGGLTAALSLQHFGVPVRVFEQARTLREIGAGVTITPNAMNALDFLGIGPALAEQAGETPRYFVRSAADGRELERGPDPGSFMPEFGVQEFGGLFDDFPEPVRELIAAIPESDLFKWGLRDREPLPAWTRGRVTMLGDAAHPMTPYLGQGACMAIEDGMILGRALPRRRTSRRRLPVMRRRDEIAPTASSWPPATREGNITARLLPVPTNGKTAVTLGLFSYNPVTEPI